MIRTRIAWMLALAAFAGFAAVALPGQTAAAKSYLCWCCIDGEVVRAPTWFCKEKGGVCYASEEEARKHCAPHCWCCLDGEVARLSRALCLEKGGACFASEEEARKNCQPPCWCCLDGEVVKLSAAECQRRGLVGYGSAAEAQKNCPPLCWCCIDGQVARMAEALCRQKGGACFASAEAAQAACSTPCWCCIGGRVVQLAPAQCEEQGGECYATPEEAKQRCRPAIPLDQCCLGGTYRVQVRGLPGPDCRNRQENEMTLTLAHQKGCGTKLTGSATVSGGRTRSPFSGAVVSTTDKCCTVEGVFQEPSGARVRVRLHFCWRNGVLKAKGKGTLPDNCVQAWELFPVVAKKPK